MLFLRGTLLSYEYVRVTSLEQLSLEELPYLFFSGPSTEGIIRTRVLCEG